MWPLCPASSTPKPSQIRSNYIKLHQMTQYDSIIFKPLPRHIPTCSHFIKTRALGFGSEAHLKLVDSSAESSTPGCRLRTSTQRRRSKEMPSSLILPCKAESFLWCFWKSMEDQVMSTCEWQYQACIRPKLNCLLSLSLDLRPFQP